MGKIYKQLSIEERALNASAMDNHRLLCRIRSLHTDSDSVLGSPRI